ncbi:MAG TPA: 30S ribosome-binding factor RbfA [Polyangia bacterium]|jgi:ribosome-binding factor A|nr:30S ribosome-binding factor RbfA [Polyangia bacterium]
MSQRVERVALQIRRELGELLPRAVKDPRVQAAGLVTVTQVHVSPDLAVARVMVSVMTQEPGDPGQATQVLRGLRQAAGFLRGELGRRLHTRRAPELRFQLDDMVDRVDRVESLLREIHAAEAKDNKDKDEADPALAGSSEAGSSPSPGDGDEQKTEA